jgi:hypothetical protein
LVAPPAQESEHAPSEQTSPAGHALSQPPQFAGSFSVSAQLWPHFVEPPLHASPQAPPEQTSPAAHGLSQPPQLLMSS